MRPARSPTWASRAQVLEVLKEIEDESGPLGTEVDDCAIKVMDALLDELPDIRARSLVWQWVGNRTIQRTLRLALHHMMGVAVWAICQDQCEYHTIQKAEIPVWDILAWNMHVKVETSDWNNTE